MLVTAQSNKRNDSMKDAANKVEAKKGTTGKTGKDLQSRPLKNSRKSVVRLIKQ